MSKPRYAFTIQLVSPADCDEEQATRALRGLLKVAWRVFGLRCVSAKPTNPITPSRECGIDNGIPSPTPQEN